MLLSCATYLPPQHKGFFFGFVPLLTDFGWTISVGMIRKNDCGIFN